MAHWIFKDLKVWIKYFLDHKKKKKKEKIEYRYKQNFEVKELHVNLLPGIWITTHLSKYSILCAFQK